MRVYEIQSSERNFREIHFRDLVKKTLIGHEKIINSNSIYYKGEVMKMTGSQINANKLYVGIYSEKRNPIIKKALEKANKGLIKLIERK